MRDQMVYLNGISLNDAHPLILLQQISEAAPEPNVKTGERAGSPGLFVTGNKLTKREITITFAVREALDFTKRAEAVSAAAAWAMNGGWLEISSRPGLRIWTVPTQLPDVGRLRDWTRDISMVLTAFAWPIWSESAPNTVTVEGETTGSVYLSVPGTWESRLEAEIVPTTAALTSAVIAVDGQTMTLSDLSVAEESKLVIYWDELHLLRIEAAGAGVLGHRTGDDLVLTPGRHEIEYTFSTACDVTFAARGCWL